MTPRELPICVTFKVAMWGSGCSYNGYYNGSGAPVV
jgi:hypothetical protein